MKTTKLLAAAAALALGSAAQAVTIDYVSTGSGSYTLFAGQVQETHISLLGCPDGGFIFSCQNHPNLTTDVPLNVFTHAVRLDAIGQNDGAFTGPSATFDIDTAFIVDGHAVTLTQEFNLKQIFNNQFQVSWGASSTKTIDLGAAGLLDLTAVAGAFQYQGGTPGGGGGSPMRTTFLLRAPVVAPVPEPASWALMIMGLGLAGAAMRQRGKVALA